ncbi:syntaxin-17 [Scaptodrosophila lebanonensis]|uniref:Syntaxin-17 n=1 Tax=Drosophila lebanonensis TaxID=7225 RepID=A0A6J2TJV7_DROLE|nr:syntaxin-17 [Scaptodrosophila lebanonensis]
MATPKIPLRQAAISVQRFNDAVPHHLSLLKNHRSNIEKSLAMGDWQKIRKEELNAMRVIKQLKNLMIEMDTLRNKVEDREGFDELMRDGKQKAFEGMKKEFAELQLKLKKVNYDDEENNEPSSDGSNQHCMLPPLQTNFRLEEHQLAQRQACLNELEHLQTEMQALNGLFHDIQGLVHEQAESVNIVADNAEDALENVQIGESNLRRALTYKKAMYPIVGALLGTCVGGPIGLVAGIKAGGLAAIGCGVLGFTGGSVLKSNPTVTHGNIEEQLVGQEQDSPMSEGLELKEKPE